MSPLLRVRYFSGFSKSFWTGFAGAPWVQIRGVAPGLYGYADEVATALARHDPRALAGAAGVCGDIVDSSIAPLELELELHKCHNLAVSPGAVVGTFSRIPNGLSDTTTR